MFTLKELLNLCLIFFNLLHHYQHHFELWLFQQLTKQTKPTTSSFFSYFQLAFDVFQIEHFTFIVFINTDVKQQTVITVDKDFYQKKRQINYYFINDLIISKMHQ